MKSRLMKLAGAICLMGAICGPALAQSQSAMPIRMATLPALLLQTDAVNTASVGGLFAFTIRILCLAVMVVFTAGFWKVFEKAGEPGWASLVPFYNAYILLKIAGRPGWWLILFLIPLVNIVIALLVAVDVAKAFGQGAGFGIVLLFLLSGIGYLVLGFGNYRYVGRAAAAATRGSIPTGVEHAVELDARSL